MVTHPEFLLGGADSDPNKLRSRGDDSPNHGLIFLGGEWPKRRRFSARDHKTGEFFLEVTRRKVGHTRFSSIKKMLGSIFCGVLTERPHKIPATDLPHFAMPLEPAKP